MLKPVKALLVAFSIILLAGGCRLPDDVKVDIQNGLDEFQAAQTQVNDAIKNFESLKTSSDWRFLEPYGKRDEWQKNIDEARSGLSEAESLKDSLEIILSSNKEADAVRALDEAAFIRELLEQAKLSSQRPQERVELLRKARDSQDEMLKKAEAEVRVLITKYKTFMAGIEAVKSKYPERAGTIADRISRVNMRVNGANTTLMTAKSTVVADPPDYLAFANSCALIESNNNELDGSCKELRDQMMELDVSYTVILVDMKIETEGNVTKYYHMYTRVENAIEQKQDWQEVDVALYTKHEKSLGMAIATKPYGYFEDEALEEATPVGLAMVGNKRYGEWQNDHTGNRYWHFRPAYMYYGSYYGMGRHRYGYNDHNTWLTSYRGRKPYYGSSSGRTLFGTDSANAKTKFAGSSFANQGGFSPAGTSALTRGPSTSSKSTGTSKSQRAGTSRRSGGFFGFGGGK